MAQINVDGDDKDWFDSFQQSGETQAEAFNRLVQRARAYNGDLYDPEQQAELTAEKMGPKLELTMYRVADEMKESD